MKELEEFRVLLEAEDKQACVSYALNLLETGRMDVPALYTRVLAPSLNEMCCKLDDKKVCVWKEHVRTAIVRTIVECSYPYVIKESKSKTEDTPVRVVVICPPEEYHEMGARMVADFFTLCGCDTVFVGGNTPYEDFYNAADVIRPEIIAVSITNYYTLVVSKSIIADLKALLKDSVRIVVGGYAVRQDSENFSVLGADERAQTLEDIRQIVDKVVAKR